MRSAMNCFLRSPRVNSRASRISWSMLSTSTRSLCGIEFLRTLKSRPLHAGVEEFDFDEVDLAPAEQGSELVEDRQDLHVLRSVEVELHKDIHVTVRPKVITEHRAEQGKALDRPPPADRLELMA